MSDGEKLITTMLIMVFIFIGMFSYMQMAMIREVQIHVGMK